MLETGSRIYQAKYGLSAVLPAEMEARKEYREQERADLIEQRRLKTQEIVS